MFDDTYTIKNNSSETAQLYIEYQKTVVHKRMVL
jgi:hypothetical protein